MAKARCIMCGREFPEKKRLRGFELCKGADIHTILPTRKTAGSAGYDLFLPFDVTIPPMCEHVIPLGIKAYMQQDEVLYIHIRSSVAFKLGLRMKNVVGVIDSDYYSNPDNDGNIGIVLMNRTGRTVELKKGERVAQGIFGKFLLVDGDHVTDERTGGMGSTGR